MIIGIFHQGSGLGNQLHRYVATRVRAADLGVDFGMVYWSDDSGKEEGFKGKSFMNLDMGKPFQGVPTTQMRLEKKVVENGIDIRGFDPEMALVQDHPTGMIIDGEFQDERYWMHREKEVDEWLKVDPLEMSDDLCVIGFRGGEFAVCPDLFLTKDYWEEGIKKMKEINPNMRFEVHTDDEVLAHQYFPDFKVIHDIGLNWRSMRYAKYAIIANSSFFILPRWLNRGVTVAPRYWARRNTKIWALPQNYYGRFSYI